MQMYEYANELVKEAWVASLGGAFSYQQFQVSKIFYYILNDFFSL